MDSISVIFVLSNEYNDEKEASEIMLQASEACKQYKVNTTWIKEKEIDKTELKKTDFIVFENFNGKDFKKIKEQKSASILGPWCLLICLMEGKKIPNFQWPIYNVAMYNCIVAISHMPKSAKIEIAEKIQKMGGYYTATLTENTTHLIADSVKSEKYLKAIEMNIKVMVPAWVNEVWLFSQEKNIHCNDDCFKRFKCPPFRNLTICCTGVSNAKDREQIKQLVTDNGGEYTPKLHLKSTDFLVCEGVVGAMSEKYKEARKTGTINCVTVQWLHDSVQKGCCLPHDMYVVKKGTSTPQKNEFINPNFSTMSVIDHSKCEKTMVEDSIMPRPFDHLSSPRPPRTVFTEGDDLINQIDVKKVKKSGQCLDGCSVYLVGFKEDQREKLCKVINASGATRCDDMTDRVTHVLVGDPECYEFKIISSKSYSCSLVNVKWLLDSIDKKRPCSEEPYLVNSTENESNFKSPLGKKGLSLLRTNRTITEIDLSESQKEKDNRDVQLDHEEDNEMMKQYLLPQMSEEDTLANLLKNANYDSRQIGGPTSQGCAEPDAPSTFEAASTLDSQDESQSLQIFNGLVFWFSGFDETQEEELLEHIVGACGRITKDLNAANYIIAPTFVTQPLHFEKGTTINDLWIFDSVNEGELVEIKYFHRPLLILSSTILENCVVTVSGFSGYERKFLSMLIDLLGGISQEQFCRVTSVERNILGSTHLVTAEASGKKYAAALKWRLPAVGKDWLLECAKREVKPPEEQFLVSEKHSQDPSNSSNSNDNPPIQSNKENISDKSKSLEHTLQNTGNEIVPPRLLQFKTDYYNIAYDITAFKDSTRNTLISTPQAKSDLTSNQTDTDSGAADVNAASAECNSNDRNSEPKDNATKTSSNEAVVEMCNTPVMNNSINIQENEGVSARRREFRTPRNRNLFKTPDGRFAEDVYSQVTPVDQIMKEARRTYLLGTPESPQLTKAPWDVDTPDTPYGAVIDPNPSKSLKKKMLRFLNQFPDKPPVRKRKLSTPLSELKRKLWGKIGSGMDSQDTLDDYNYEDADIEEALAEPRKKLFKKMESQNDESDDDDEETESEKVSNTQSMLINTRLQKLEEIMVAAGNSASKSRRQSRVVPERVSECNIGESQPCTVQWDYGKDTQEELPPKPKIFMLSGLSFESKAEIGEQLRQLGGIVLDTNNYSAESTHLLCPKPARNEKTLSCMAAGKWILHIDFVDACIKAGTFLKEEEYEFGNTNAIGKISIELDREIETRMQAIHYWRNQIARTGLGAFHNMRAIIVAEKRQALVTVIEAGGGSVVNVEPPFEGPVHATHCLIEPKSAPNFALYEPLAKQGIYCVNTLYLSDFLHRTSNDIKDSILPFYQKYFR